MREPTEMRGGVCGRFADDLQAEAAADRFGDAAKPDAFFGDGVIARAARRACLERKAIEPRRIAPMHRWPDIVAVGGINRNAGLACDLDEHRDEAMTARAMHRSGQPQHDDAHALRRDRSSSAPRCTGAPAAASAAAA